MKKIISCTNASLPILTDLQDYIFTPGRFEIFTKNLIPLVSTPPETLAENLHYHRLLLLGEMQDEVIASLDAIDTDSAPYFRMSYKSTAKKDDHYFFRMTYDGDMPKSGDVLLLESTQKQSVIVKVVKSGPTECTVMTPKWMDSVVWASKRIDSCRGYLLVSLGPIQRCYDAVQDGYFTDQSFDQALLSINAPITTPRNQPQALNIPDHLNQEQQAAVLEFINLSKGLLLWNAPPGTGKTTAILEAIRLQLEIAPRQQVLVAAPSNKGVITVMERFHQNYPTVKIGFVGNVDKLNEYAPHLAQFVCDKPESVRSKQVIFSTLNSSGKYQLTISAVIVDEAGQSKISETRIPFKHNPAKILLVGDPRQLPPTIKSKRVKMALGDTSLLYYLIENKQRAHHFFSQGYRMDPQINQWVSGKMYNGRLSAS